MSGWSDDLNACAALVEKGDPARFRTVMAASVPVRAPLFALYAFNVEVSRAPWLTAEPMIAEMRLQWWRDALEEIAAGGAVRRHEVVSALAQVLSVEQARRLDALVAARRWECYREPFEDGAHLNAYLRDTSGLLVQVAAECLAGPYRLEGPAGQAGFALGVANWLRAVPALEAQGRIPLLDGTPDGVRALARTGLEAWRLARRARLPRAAVPAFWPASGSARALNAAIEAPARVADGTLPQPERLRFTLKAALSRW